MGAIPVPTPSPPSGPCTHMRLVELDQGSPEWLLWRTTGLGCSEAPAVVEQSKWLKREQLLEEKARSLAGLPNPQRNNWAMMRGKRLEPHVRNLYARRTRLDPRPVCALHAHEDFLKASLDGYDELAGVALEIKCAGQEDHRTALDGLVPAHYAPQVSHILLVGGEDIERVDYVSYNDRLSPSLAIVRCHHEPHVEYALYQALQAFWDEVLDRAIALGWQPSPEQVDSF